MKKDTTRDYCIQMFRIYAIAGFPTYEDEKIRLYKQTLERFKMLSDDEAKKKATETVEKNTPYLMDISAIEQTFCILKESGNDHIVAAILAVYCCSPKKRIKKNDISNRVQNFAISYGADQRSVYRWLNEARKIAANIRGLNLSCQ